MSRVRDVTQPILQERAGCPVQACIHGTTGYSVNMALPQPQGDHDGLKSAGGLSEEPKRVVSKRVVLADIPPERKPERGYVRMFLWNEEPERGYVRMFPRNENRNEGTFAKTTPLRNRPFISQ